MRAVSTLAHSARKRCETARELTRQSERALARSEELIEKAERLMGRYNQRVLNIPLRDALLP